MQLLTEVKLIHHLPSFLKPCFHFPSWFVGRQSSLVLPLSVFFPESVVVFHHCKVSYLKKISRIGKSHFGRQPGPSQPVLSKFDLLVLTVMTQLFCGASSSALGIPKALCFKNWAVIPQQAKHLPLPLFPLPPSSPLPSPHTGSQFHPSSLGRALRSMA